MNNRLTWVPPSEISSSRRWLRRDILLCLHCGSTVASTDARVTDCEVGASVPFPIPLQSRETLLQSILTTIEMCWTVSLPDHGLSHDNADITSIEM